MSEFLNRFKGGVLSTFNVGTGVLCAGLVVATLSLTACGGEAETQAGDITSDSTKALTILGAEAGAPAFLSNVPLVASDGMKILAVSVEGMHCAENCATKVYNLTEAIDGVDECRVSFENQMAWVQVPESSTMTAEQLAKTLEEKTGFTVKAAS